ncbi:hypothetical protein WR25_18165 [Diploscapter pachys]|uniref:Methionine--tRNA ligase, mitochondrial n=1 Tax=Diploscapter pachys TaxID=2018661 RepID=A0A2A2JI09_9BILA|nr:hypothetical protein WR25_18165 [Diploscapter pachys]
MKLARLLVTPRRFHSFTTNPIFYVNAGPHIGHLYTALLSDAHCRWMRLKQPNDTHKLTVGTDEHGMKIWNTAKSRGKEPQQHCDEISQEFAVLFRKFGISHTDFIRTTQHRHIEAVLHFWNILMEKDLIYKSSYEGWYSTVDECFYANDEVQTVKINGKDVTISKETQSEVQWTQEENYMFRLTKFLDKIDEWITNRDAIRPLQYVPSVKRMLSSTADLSVSRPRSRLPWGIAVPGDNSQTIYVWLDALVNYLTLAAFPQQMTEWPPTCQLIGKDILKFHAIYWPSFLLGAGFELPQRIFVHGHWLVDNRKMSKSLGNVVDPNEAAQRLTVEGLRYFLLRQGVPHEDSNYTEKKAVEVINADLVNNLGNLLSRSTIDKLNPAQKYPPFDISTLDESSNVSALLADIHQIREKVAHSFDDLMFYKGLEHVMALLKQANGFFQLNQPWKMRDGPKLQSILYLTYESVRISSVLLQPIVPNLADRCLTRLGVSTDRRDLPSATLGGSADSFTLGSHEGNVMNRLQ